jgi:Fe-S-cluster containining protein
VVANGCRVSRGSAIGVLSADEIARVEFFARFADVACSSLDPEKGACMVYEWHPLSCRTHKLPVR